MLGKVKGGIWRWEKEEGVVIANDNVWGWSKRGGGN